ncbi:MAG: putative lipid II flippase FtsW [Candidatus Falkowbacteria bacterium]|nr:putative lipid II flippase FtsW [Candidatus Falkowbacteria bacterium]
MFARLKALFNKHVEFSPDRLESDQVFKVVVALLLIFGLIMLASASSITAYNSYQDTYYFFKKQFVSILVGVACFWFFSKINYKRLRFFALPALIISIVLLLLVFIPGLGKEINGSKSWLNIFGYSLQPAEFVKLTFIVYLAALFEKGSETANRFRSFLVLYGALAVLMLLQPDLGTLSILTVASFCVYYVGGGKLKHILGFIAAGVIGLVILVNLPGQGYKLDRFKCFIDSNRDTGKSCYQINQSLIAIGSGGVLGRGLGESRQKFLYLPEVQNDFIFAIIAEETGLVGSAIVILLFVLIFYRGWIVAHRLTDPYGRNLVVGIMVWIVGQAVLNIGGITNFLPMTGVPLPLISYGGTAIIAALAGLGIISSASRYVR